MHYNHQQIYDAKSCAQKILFGIWLSLVTSTLQKSKVHSVSQCLNVQSRLNEQQQFTVSK